MDRDSLADLPADSRREIVAEVRAVLDVDAATAEDLFGLRSPYGTRWSEPGLVDSWDGGELCHLFPRDLAFIRSGAVGGPESTIRYNSSVDSPTSTPGALLRRARKRAGITQQELAARAGVAQSVISAYESGHRQPAVPTLAALIEAAGYELVMDLRPQPPELSRLSGPLGRRVRRRRRDLVAVAASHGVQNLRVFGSVARGQDRPDSDVDLLADLPPGLSLFGLARVQADLEAILGAPVDLVPAQDLRPGVRARVENELVGL